MVLSCDDILACVSWCSPPPLPGPHVHEVPALGPGSHGRAPGGVGDGRCGPGLENRCGTSSPPSPLSSPSPTPLLPCSTGRMSSPSSFFVKLAKRHPQGLPGNPVDFAFQRREYRFQSLVGQLSSHVPTWPKTPKHETEVIL